MTQHIVSGSLWASNQSSACACIFPGLADRATSFFASRGHTWALGLFLGSLLHLVPSIWRPWRVESNSRAGEKDLLRLFLPTTQDRFKMMLISQLLPPKSCLIFTPTHWWEYHLLNGMGLNIPPGRGSSRAHGGAAVLGPALPSPYLSSRRQGHVTCGF